MSAATVCSCSRPIRDSTFLCSDCTRTLEQRLAELPALAGDLDTTRTRTSRTGGRDVGVVSRSTDRPVPWDDRASRLAVELKALAVTWVHHCQSFRVRPPGPTCERCSHRSCAHLRSYRAPADVVESLAGYLLASLPALRHRPEVTELADQMETMRARVSRVIDRPAELNFFGPCGAMDYWPDGEPVLCSAPCTGELYGEAAASALTCQTCGAEHDVQVVRRYLLAEAQDQLVTAADLSKFLTAYGEPLTAERIRQWASRGLLVPHAKDRAGRPVYRVSEAVERLSALATRGSARSA